MYRSKLSSLEENLSKLQQESAQHQEVLNATVQSNKAQTDKLQEEKAMLEVWREITLFSYCLVLLAVNVCDVVVTLINSQQVCAHLPLAFHQYNRHIAYAK